MNRQLNDSLVTFDVPIVKRNPVQEIYPRLCFIGPLVGKNPGHVTTQGEILSSHFAKAGYQVVTASSAANRYARLADIVRTLVRNKHNIDIQIVHIYGGRSFVVEDVASQLGSRYGFGIIMMLHGGALPTFINRFPGWARRVFSRAHVISAPSEYLARAMTNLGFECRITPNVIDTDLYPYRLRQKVAPNLFWMRSFHPVWNPFMAVKVLAELRTVLPHATLVMAGQDKGMLGETRQLAAQLKVEDAIRFAGFLDPPGKWREGDAADIFISTNHIDNMPIAVVEACAMGLPVVTTNVGGIPDLLKNEETGLLVEDNDVTGMVNAICRLVLDQELAGKLSAKGRELAQKSSWNRVRLLWENMFEHIMSRPNPT
jgi:glycosyltransferase involved in cell wall biosynthesis